MSSRASQLCGRPRPSNLYGDFHFELRQHVRKRAAYSFGTGAERRDFRLLLADWVRKHAPAKSIQDLADGKLGGTEIEIHIYGPINFRSDVEAIHFPPTIQISITDQLELLKDAPEGTEQAVLAQAVAEKTNAARNLIQFANDHGITCLGGTYDTLTKPKVVAPDAAASLPPSITPAVKSGQKKGFLGIFSLLSRKKK